MESENVKYLEELYSEESKRARLEQRRHNHHAALSS